MARHIDYFPNTPKRDLEVMWMGDTILPVRSVDWTIESGVSTARGIGLGATDSEQIVDTNIMVEILTPEFNELFTVGGQRKYERCEIFGIDKEVILYNSVLTGVSVAEIENTHMIELFADDIAIAHR